MSYKKSTLVPAFLLIYLAIMSYVGFSYFQAGEYFFYFGIIGLTLLIIVFLHFNLKKREKYRRERENDMKDNS